jgi:predicted FMN-binding regulatory protein PaiB
MYVHAAFRADADRALAMLRELAFGTLVVADGAGRPVAAHVPFPTEPRDGGGCAGRAPCRAREPDP